MIEYFTNLYDIFWTQKVYFHPLPILLAIRGYLVEDTILPLFNVCVFKMLNNKLTCYISVFYIFVMAIQDNNKKISLLIVQRLFSNYASAECFCI